MKDSAAAARRDLVLDHPWWGALALRLEIVPLPEVKAAATDGRHLFYNPAWIARLSASERVGVVAHEVEHCAFRHIFRRDGLDDNLAQEAADHVVNLDLEAAGFVLPKPNYADPRFTGMAFERVYAILLEEQQEKPRKPKKPTDPRNWGKIIPQSSKDSRDAEDLEREWEKAVETATHAAAKAGHLPASLKRLLDEAKRPQSDDLVAALQPYLSVKASYSYARPNRRLWCHGLRLPGPVKSRLGNVVIAVDTSGSISDRSLAYFREKVTEVLSMDEPPERIWVLYVDAAVHGVDEITDGELEFNPVGGGGTRFGPAFRWVEEAGIVPDVLIYLTDLDCSDVPVAPGYPVVWAVPLRDWNGPPDWFFGEAVIFAEAAT